MEGIRRDRSGEKKQIGLTSVASKLKDQRTVGGVKFKCITKGGKRKE